MLGLGNNLDLVQKFQLVSIPHKTSSNPKHLRYKLVPKTEVLEIRKDHSLTVRDPTQCLAHVLDDKFILLNSRLKDLSLQSKNAQIGVRTRKLWPSEVDAADLQGWYGNLGTHPFSILPRFAQF